jgi:hypothetical protein
MNTLGLVVSMILAFLIYGTTATIAAFLALSVWAAGLEISMFLMIVAAIGLGTGILGAAVPVLRRFAIGVLTALAPSGW